MGHTFTSSNTLDLSAVEGQIIKNICENENEQITDINIPVEGSLAYDYSRVQDLLNKLQDKDSNLSDSEIDNLYDECKKILDTYSHIRYRKDIKTLNEVFIIFILIIFMLFMLFIIFQEKKKR